MAGHEHQGRAQGGNEGILPLPGKPHRRAGGGQQADEQDKAHRAGLHQHLDVVVVGVFRLVVEALDALHAVLKGPQAQADHRTAAKELHAVGEEDKALDGVLVGPQALETVGDKAGQQLVAQGDAAGAGLAGADSAVQPGLAGGGEIEVDHQTVLRHGEGGPGQGALVEGGAGVHHGLLLVLALDVHRQIPLRLRRQGVGPGLRIGGPAQGLAGLESRAAGEVVGRQGKDGHAGQDHAGEDQHDPAVAGELVRQRTAQAVQQAQQRRASDDAQQGHRPESGPGGEGGQGDEEGCGNAENQGFHHEQQQLGPPLRTLQQQVGEEGQGDHAAGAHTEGQQEGQGVDIQADQVDGPLPSGGGDNQAEAQKGAQAHAAGEYVGVGEHGGHTDPLLHRAQAGVVRGEQAQQPQNRGADDPGGEQVNAHQPRQGGEAGEDCRAPAAGTAALPVLHGQQQQGQAEGGQGLEELIEGEFPASGVEGGQAVHEHHQSQGQDRQVQTVPQAGEEHRRPAPAGTGPPA